MEGVLTLAIISQRWRAELESEEFPKVSTLVLYRLKYGMRVILHKRTDVEQRHTIPATSGNQ